MLHDLQAQLVERLDAHRALAPAAGTLVPSVAEPYGGQLLNPDRLITAVPAVYVELDKGVLARMGSSPLFEGRHATDVICAARNARAAGQMHDGARLMSWVIDWARTGTLVLAGEQLRCERIAWRRLATDREQRTWTGILTLYWTASQ